MKSDLVIKYNLLGQTKLGRKLLLKVWIKLPKTAQTPYLGEKQNKKTQQDKKDGDKYKLTFGN